MSLCVCVCESHSPVAVSWSGHTGGAINRTGVSDKLHCAATALNGLTADSRGIGCVCVYVCVWGGCGL